MLRRSNAKFRHECLSTKFQIKIEKNNIQTFTQHISSMTNNMISASKINEFISTVDATLDFFGVPIPAHATIIELQDKSGVVLYSPLAIDSAEFEQLVGSKKVLAIVAPNSFHHLFAHQGLINCIVY